MSDAGDGGGVKSGMLRRLAGQLDDSDIEGLVNQGVREKVVPALQAIRDRRASQPPAEEIREKYRQLPDEKQQQTFDQAVMGLVELAWSARDNPQEAAQKAQTLIRDPYTMEALLLIFENAEHIDPEYSDQLKETALEVTQWVAVALAPEMYDQETVERVASHLGLDVERYRVGQ